MMLYGDNCVSNCLSGKSQEKENRRLQRAIKEGSTDTDNGGRWTFQQKHCGTTQNQCPNGGKASVENYEEAWYQPFGRTNKICNKGMSYQSRYLIMNPSPLVV